MRGSYRLRLLVGGAIVGVACGPTAHAQNISPEMDNIGTDEIIVTANKREQNLNDVGLTITAIGGEELIPRRGEGDSREGFPSG